MVVCGALLRREVGAALAAARGNDGAAGAGAHAGAEAVLTSAAAVIRLESPLRHGKLLELGATASGGASPVPGLHNLPGQRPSRREWCS